MDIDGSVSVGVLRAVKRGFDFHEMERHVETPEMLVAVQGDVLVPVAPANHPADAPAAEETEVFHLRQGEALIMNTGVWHWLPFPLQGEAVLLVVFKEGTPDNDFTLYDLQAGKGQHLTLRVTESGAACRCGCDK
jgi:ureidoglycolate lyase